MQKWTQETENTKDQQDVIGPRVADVRKRGSVQLCLHYSLQDLQLELSIPMCTE